MKIAIPTQFNRLSEDIKASNEITVFTVNNTKIENNLEFIKASNIPHSLPVLLKNNQIDCIITGKISEGLIEKFKKQNIQTITGVPVGPARMLIEIYALQNDKYIQRGIT